MSRFRLYNADEALQLLEKKGLFLHNGAIQPLYDGQESEEDSGDKLDIIFITLV